MFYAGITKKQTPKKKIRITIKKKKDTETTETTTTSQQLAPTTSTTTSSPRTKTTARKSTSTPTKTKQKPAILVTPISQRSPAKTQTPETTPTQTPPTNKGSTQLSPVMSPTPEGTPNISPVIQQTTTAIVVANMGDEEEQTETSKNKKKGSVHKVEKTTKTIAKKKPIAKRKTTETESPIATTRSKTKKQRIEEEDRKKKVAGKRKRAEKDKRKGKREDEEDDEFVAEKKKGKGKGKKELQKEDTDDEDFVVEVKKDKKKGKQKMEEEVDDKAIWFKSLRAKTTVKPFYEATHKLSPERKQRVREMGFGSLLGFPYNKFPAKIPYFLLKNLDEDKMQINLPKGGVIKITPRKIREVLGIPMGPIPFYAERKRLPKDSVYCQFMAQLPSDKRQRKPTLLSNIIQKSEGTDFIFDLNYLMLFANCLVSCKNSAMLQYDVLENIKSSEDIHKIDWCTYIWNCMKNSKKKWDDKTFENWYYGPHVTFTVSKS